jgi:hypothetical protein
VAAIRLSGRVRRWMAPLPARAGVLTRTSVLPTFAVIAGAGAFEGVLLLGFGVSYRSSAVIGLGTAVIGCLATLFGVLLGRAISRGKP